MNWSTEKIVELLGLMNSLDVISLNKEIRGERDEHICELGDVVQDPRDGPQEILENKERRKLLLKYIEQLEPVQSLVIKQRFGFDDGNAKTLEEIGRLHGVTRERIRQIETKALQKLKWLITVKGKCHDVNNF